MNPYLIGLFYVLVVVLVYVFRKKFEFHGRIFGLPLVGLLKTKVGLKTMDVWAAKAGPLVRGFGYFSIVLGFAGMILIVFVVIQGVWNLFFVPGAAPAIAPVLPGVKIPGVPIFIPFVEGIISIFIVAAVHEFAHGVVARAHKIKVNSSGLAIFGPIFGAFVEPDEKQVPKAPDRVQYSIFAAGPAINIVMAVLVFILAVFMMPLGSSMAEPSGFSFANTVGGSPAALAGLDSSLVYDSFNGNEISSLTDFASLFSNTSANESVVFGSGDVETEVVLGDKSGSPWIGIEGLENSYNVFPGKEMLWSLFTWVLKFLNIFVLLSLGIGTANLLPVGPIDGGRMTQRLFTRVFGDKTGTKIWIKISLVLFIVIIGLLAITVGKGLLTLIPGFG